MKYSLIIFFIIITQNAISQTYTFNQFSKYKIEGKRKYIRLSEAYSNSEDKSYYMRISKNGDGKIAAKIIDMKKNEIHYFNISESQKSTFIFHHETTIAYDEKSKINLDNYELLNNSIETQESKYILRFYHNKKKKKSYDHQLNVRQNGTSSFHLFRINCWHPFESAEEFDYKIDGVVEFASSKDFTYKLEAFEPIENITIKI